MNKSIDESIREQNFEIKINLIQIEGWSKELNRFSNQFIASWLERLNQFPN